MGCFSVDHLIFVVGEDQKIDSDEDDEGDVNDVVKITTMVSRNPLTAVLLPSYANYILDSFHFRSFSFKPPNLC